MQTNLLTLVRQKHLKRHMSLIQVTVEVLREQRVVLFPRVPNIKSFRNQEMKKVLQK
jgi:hypothetical protein